MKTIFNSIVVREPGKIVLHPIHGQGRTKNSDPHPQGKVPVYFDGGMRILCDPDKLKCVGFID